MRDTLRAALAGVMVAVFATAGLAAEMGPSATWAEYETRKAGTGPGAVARVRLALWCEQQGLPAQRDQHLARAVLMDPGNVLARGLMGFVEYKGRWLTPEKVAGLLRNDAAENHALAEYNRRRDALDRRDLALRDDAESAATDPGAGAKAAADRARRKANAAMERLMLGCWCQRAGLPDEARVEFTTALRMNPRLDDAWRHLGCVRFEGRWMPVAEAATAAAEARAQREADHKWGKALLRWRVGLSDPALQAEAEAQLAQVTDPRAVGAVARVFAGEPERIVQLLGQIESPSSTAMLARGAVFSKSDDIRSSALALLKTRPTEDYVKVLVDMIRTPATYEYMGVRGPGSTGVLVIDTPRYRLERDYTAPGLFDIDWSTFYGYIGYDVNGLPLAIRGRDLREGLTPESLWYHEAETARMIQRSYDNARRTEQRILDDIARLNRTNERTRETNARAAAILQTSFGAPELGDDEVAWQRWYYNLVGYTYTPPQKVTVTSAVKTHLSPALLYSCFAAGTLVQTLDGPRPIEQVRPADRVLSQDTATGALGFQAVLVAHHNPPCETVRLTLEGGEELQPSIYHRFWTSGKGWVMAREIRRGDLLRRLGGQARVVSAEPGPEVPVFNLTVAAHHTFFVGRGEWLVHDNTLPSRSARPFDDATAAGR